MSAPRESRPPAKRAAGVSDDTHKVALTGCPNGCSLDYRDEDVCPTWPEAPDHDGHCCGPYTLDQLAGGHGCPVHRLEAS